MLNIKSAKMLIVMVLLAASNIFCAADKGIDISQINMNDLESQLPAEFANTNLTLDDAKTLIKDKCIKVVGKEDGEKAYDEIESALGALTDCAQNIVNFTAIQDEIKEASPRGELDVVFNKYCNRRPQAIECIEKFSNKISKCLDKEEKENQEVFMRIGRSLLDFICHKGGDQIALFIAEKGPECLESKKDDIQQCINNTFAGYMPKEGLESVKTLPKLVLGEQQCQDMHHLEKCVVAKLENCDEITPANIVESMFRFVKNETICRTTSTNASAAKQSGMKSGVAATLLMNSGMMFALLVIFQVIMKRLQI